MRLPYSHIRLLGLFMLVLVLASTSTASLFAASELSGRQAPGFALPDLNLNYHDLQDHRGKVVIVDIMRTVCPHCLAVSKNLEKIKAKFGTRVAILSIVNPPDNQQTVTRFLAENKLSTPVLFDCGQVSAVYLKVTPQNPSITIPHIFLIDQQGMIRNDFVHGDSTKDLLEGDGLAAEVEKLLNRSAKPAQTAPLGQLTGPWLDHLLKNWNQTGAAIPRPPSDGENTEELKQRGCDIRKPSSREDLALTKAGWTLFGPIQTYSDVTLIAAKSGGDGMCRPTGYNDFIFVAGQFAGTLAPFPMESRTDGAGSSAQVLSPSKVSAEFIRYSEADPQCCPSRITTVEYEIVRSPSGPIVLPRKAFTAPR